MGVLLALVEAVGLVLAVLRVALVACLVDASLTNVGVSGHDDGFRDVVWRC
jgi:hypothetical protein